MPERLPVRRMLTADAVNIQFRWSLWFVLIMYPILAFLEAELFFATNLPDDLSFRSFLVEPGKIYMLIIGIIFPLAYFRFFLSQGLTRRVFYQANTAAAAIVSTALIVTLFLLSWVLQLLFGFADGWLTAGAAPFPGLPDTALVQVGAASLVFFQYYMVGWLIPACFLRGGGWMGAASIVGGLLFMSATDSLMQQASLYPAELLVPAGDLSLSPWVVGLLQGVLTAALLAAVWIVLRRMPLKAG
ncbi:hypothetical protein [Alkalicoccus chagannorensis]|uniref:hypothetical protein n=1 Tax=Alkalicoccus chagannorensis TaxID=427072 RepID=UPI0004250894|nr:hypothetical protein [Alkalicoccus chagannorensis]